MKEKNAMQRGRFPLWAILWISIAGGLTALAGGSYILYRYNRSFAEWMNNTVGYATRRIMAGIGNLVPFSLGETLILLSPVLLFVLLYFGIRYARKSLRATLIYLGALLTAAATVFQLFAFGFAPGYYAIPVDQKLGLDRKKVSPEELYETASVLVERIEETVDEISFLEGGFSVMPYSIETMNAKLLQAYEALAQKEEWLHTFNSSVKPVVMSVGMSYLHITGVYTFFTGEANINIDFPDYTIPYTAAHELAHQRGIAREEEANFVAFLVCMESDDPYIRYSGLVNLYEYVISALGRADSKLSSAVRSALDRRVLAELRAYSEFYKKYQHSTAGAVSNAVNNSYLQSQGSVGVKSYGMVVDLAVAYFSPEKGE